MVFNWNLNSRNVFIPLNIVCPSFLQGGGFEPPSKFSKRGSWTGPQLLEGSCWERGGGVTFFRWGGCNFHIKIKLKTAISNDKKSLSAKIFFSAITKNSNWEILPKNLVTIKR